MEIREILEQRNKKLAECRRILDVAKADKRSMNPDEANKFDSLMRDANLLKNQADAIHRGEDPFEAQLRAADEEGRQSMGRKTSDEWLSTAKPGLFIESRTKLSDITKADRGEAGLDLGKLVNLAVGNDIPGAELERRTLGANLDSSGGFTVPTNTSAQILDLMRNNSVIFRAGARVYPMKSSKEILPKLVEDFQGTWKPENVLQEPTTGVFGATNLQAKTLYCWLPVSNELLADAIGLDDFLKNAIGQMMATTVDRAALVGTGVGDQPLGVFHMPDVATTATISGTAFNYDDLINSHGRVEGANYVPTAMVCSTGTRTHYRKLKDGEGRYLQPLDWMAPILATNSIPNTFGSGTQAAFLVGDFSNLVVGIRSNLRIEILKEVAAQRYQTVIAAAMRCDVGIMRNAAFDICGPATL